MLSAVDLWRRRHRLRRQMRRAAATPQPVHMSCTKQLQFQQLKLPTAMVLWHQRRLRRQVRPFATPLPRTCPAEHLCSSRVLASTAVSWWHRQHRLLGQVRHRAAAQTRLVPCSKRLMPPAVICQQRLPLLAAAPFDNTLLSQKHTANCAKQLQGIAHLFVS